MAKRIYIVISLLSIASMMHSMNEGKRSALSALSQTLDEVVGKEHVGTLTTIEQDLGIGLNDAEKELTYLGVTPNRIYEVTVVCGALWGLTEGTKYFYNRYFPAQASQLDPYTAGHGTAVATASKQVDVLGQFVSTQQINEIVEAKWKGLMAQASLADKTYVDTAAAQIRNMATSALETTASRVGKLEGQVQGIATIVNGDSGKQQQGIMTRFDLFHNRIAALENAHTSSSRKGVKKDGIIDKLFKKKKEGEAGDDDDEEDKTDDKL